MKIERVLLIRHGETDWNAERRWQGKAPTPLNGRGLEQAQRLAAYLRRRPIGSIYSSDLVRAWQTASILGEALGLAPRPESRLRELNVGVFQGLTPSECLARYPDDYARFREFVLEFVIPNGESRLQLQERMAVAWHEIAANAKGPEVVIVSHGGAIRMLLLKLFAHHADLIDTASFENTSITTAAHEHGRWQLIDIATVPHLIV